MDQTLEPLMIDVRASTQGFAADVAQMRTTFDSQVTDGFSRAGSVLETGLLGAIRKGNLGFQDLRKVALAAIGDIAASAVQSAIGSAGSGAGLLSGLLGGGASTSASSLGGLLGSLTGLTGRATGGQVNAGRGYIVGERGPELFVPTSSGKIDTMSGKGGRDVRVSINVNAPKGASTPESLQRSGRQVARMVRRALMES